MFTHKQNPILIIVVAVTVVVPLTTSTKIHHPDNFGKPCSKNDYPEGSLVHCDLNHNMYCSEKGVCDCIVGERGRVFVHYDKTCIEVASQENDFACNDDVQCKLSSFGKYSRCNRDFDKCVCHDDDSEAVNVDNVCYIKMSPRALRSTNGLQGCTDDGDCQRSSLGIHSRCNKAGNVHSCECYDWSDKNPEVTLYNGTCVYKKKMGEFCSNDNECRAGYHKHAVCGPHPAYLPKERICQCPQGRSCDRDDGSGGFSNIRGHPSSVLMIGVTTLVMGILATKVLS